ncbi:MAG: HAD hydrolase family protein [Streptococcus sp.]
MFVWYLGTNTHLMWWPNGISKASGVELMSWNMKISNQINAMMFGDGPNDMEIFDYVGLKIAMGNATPELKEKADYVTGTVEEDGIFHALEELWIGRKRTSFPAT